MSAYMKLARERRDRPSPKATEAQKALKDVIHGSTLPYPG